MLIRSFISLSKFDPDTVARVFLEKIEDHLNKSNITIEESSHDKEAISENDSDDDSQSKCDDPQNRASSPPAKILKFQSKMRHRPPRSPNASPRNPRNCRKINFY
jgi:hypothetical protein